MESSEVSIHQVKVYDCLKLRGGGWTTANEVAQAAGVACRTARHHCLKLVKLGIVDQAEVFPAHRYQLSEFAAKRNKTYVQRLEAAKAIFGMP